MTPYGPETGPRFLPGHVMFIGLGIYFAHDFSVETPPPDSSELVPLQESVPAGAFLPLIENEDAYLQWISQQEGGHPPLVLAIQASTEVANHIAGRPLSIDTQTSTGEALVLEDDIEIAAGNWFAYAAQEIPASSDPGLTDDSAATPLLSVGTEACDCELLIDFAVPAQLPGQFLGFLRFGIRNHAR
jgi:hypothetical protein